MYVPVLATISSFPIWNGAPVSSRAESEDVTSGDTGVFLSLLVTDHRSALYDWSEGPSVRNNNIGSGRFYE